MAALLKVSQDREPEDPVFVRYAKERGMDNCSQMLMKRLRRVIADKKADHAFS